MSRYASIYARLIANSDAPTESGCWAWTGPSSRGYGRMSSRVPGRRSPVGRLTHRIMAEYWRQLDAQRAADDAAMGAWWDTPLHTVQAPPLDPDQQTVDHICCNRLCVNPDHLRVMSRVDNSRDMRRRRRCEST